VQRAGGLGFASRGGARTGPRAGAAAQRAERCGGARLTRFAVAVMYEVVCGVVPAGASPAAAALDVVRSAAAVAGLASGLGRVAGGASPAVRRPLRPLDGNAPPLPSPKRASGGADASVMPSWRERWHGWAYVRVRVCTILDNIFDLAC